MDGSGMNARIEGLASRCVSWVSLVFLGVLVALLLLSSDTANSIALWFPITNPRNLSQLSPDSQHPSSFCVSQESVLFEKFCISTLTSNRLTLTFIKRF